MVFNNPIFLWVGVLWLALLTAGVIYRERQFRRFLGKAKSTEIRKLLEDLLREVSQNGEAVKKVGEALNQIRRKDLRHIQKVGLVRFNPFRDVGGNQSFSLALLNEEDSGIILTGLHARETTRLYMKDIVRGSGKTELSKEEKQAIEIARK